MGIGSGIDTKKKLEGIGLPLNLRISEVSSKLL